MDSVISVTIMREKFSLEVLKDSFAKKLEIVFPKSLEKMVEALLINPEARSLDILASGIASRGRLRIYVDWDREEDPENICKRISKVMSSELKAMPATGLI
jgi:hypothetical protein